MSAQTLARIDRIAQAGRAARAQPHIDINCTLTPCPASQAELFVVPVRYALAEERAEDRACAPGVITQSRPLAARRLRAGFVYVWQDRGPLKRYAVAANGLFEAQALDDDSTLLLDGSQAGLALEKIHDAWMLYSEFPLGAEHCQVLSDSPAERRQHMRHVALRTVANELQAEHCPPLDNAPQVMAELIPDTYARSMKADRQRDAKNTEALGASVMKDPTLANIKAYTDAMHLARERDNVIARHPKASDQRPGEWSAEPWDGQGVQDWLERVKAESQALFAVFACLDDDLGVLRDINHEQEWIEARHEQWLGDNNLRLSIGGFIRSLIDEDGAELAGSISYRYKDRDIRLTPQQGQVMLDTQHRLDEALQAETRRRQYGGQPNQAEATARDARIAEIVAPVRAFIPADLYGEVEFIVREYHEEKHATRLSAEVGEYINLDAMNHWFEQTATAHYQQLEQRHSALFADRGVYLPRSRRGTWFVDYHDLTTREWLTELATDCLSAQCIRARGAEQYADYVRAPDGGALQQLFNAWTPSLEGAMNSASRLNELLAALAADNLNATHQALAPLSPVILRDIAAMAREAGSAWSTLVNRLAAALLLLKDDSAVSRHWLGVFIAARLGSDVRLHSVTETGHTQWKALGQQGEALTQWAKNAGQGIGAGYVDRVIKSEVVLNSGGVVPLVLLLLNVLNTKAYLDRAGVLEGMDSRRMNETVSATLYAGAALVAVVDMQVRRGLGIREIGKGTTLAPTLTLFGGVIGALSSGAAINEFLSLQTQLENAQNRIDPWMQMRQNAVGGQIAAFGTQALLGLSYTARALAGSITVEAAILRYTLYMGPLNWMIGVLGLIYLIAWINQQTPLQNFLNDCCWSKARAGDLQPIAPKAQQEELDRLYFILYAPRVSMHSVSELVPSRDPSGMAFESSIKALTIDLPGAEPGSAYLELSMIGNPVDTMGNRDLIKNSPFVPYKPPRPWRDMTPHWLRSSTCQWIPFKEGQGLRLSGPFNTLPNVWSTAPGKVSLRLRYRTPVTAMLGTRTFIGGERGVAFTLHHDTGVIELWSDPTPELDRAPNYPLGEDRPSAIYLQPKDKR